MRVPFLDLHAGYSELKSQVDTAIARVSQSGWYVLGPEVEAFEQSFAGYCEATSCVGVANGLDALHIGLLALGIGPGDEVIVPSNTYIATWLAVTQAGAKVVPVEPDPLTHNIDPALIEQAITSRTRAILPVHLYGLPADMDAICQIAARHGLAVLEDAAQAHGARYKGRRIGSHGDLVAWSFYPSKNLGAMGDAGGLTLREGALADKIRALRNYGSARRYVNEVRGLNSRLDPIQAAVLGTKLQVLDEWNERRAQTARYYQEHLGQATRLTLPVEPKGTLCAWHLFVVRHPDRDHLHKALADRGVDTLIHYPIAPHLQQAYADLGLKKGALPIAERLADEVLSLPIGPHITPEQRRRVVEAVLEVEGLSC
ncbi:MAG: DegT/DnrJ/EryC1/StrS family aminotransferase [Aquabacterium sp.]|jgi:dTDP-4-amino-4,6-dideoxygalactose transaminase|uniref:DegT/DnrJ/EryC1/StrS family aminotransferase n=1 Tax=Aquabacterium sp. TaxID=1872578 RepID=UPI003BAF4DAD